MMFMLVLAFESDSDAERFEFVYNHWKRLMLSKAYSVLRDYDLAQDAVSEAFIRVYKNLNKLGDLESGRTAAFLIMITRNAALTMLSRNKRVVVVDTEDYNNDKPDGFDLEGAVVAKHNADAIMAVVDRLKEELKTPFLLQYAYGLSLREIGKTLNISENNAAVRISRAKAKLSDMLRKEGLVDGFGETRR